jgi:PAS domain S-box-containing protein
MNKNASEEQLIRDLQESRKKIAELERLEAEHKQDRERLQESEEKFRNIFESVNDGLIYLDKAGRILEVNEKAVQMFGGLKEELVGKHFTMIGIFSKENMPKLMKAFKGILSGKINPINISIKNTKGQELYLECSASVRKTDVRPFGMIVVARDVTERKQAEDRLKTSEERLKVLFEFAPDAIYINDLKGNFIDGNKAAEKLTGYKREELIGKSFLKLKLLSMDQIPKAAALLAKNALRKATGPDEFIMQRKDGTHVAVEISTFPVKIKKQIFALGIARDITERRQAEENIKQLQEYLQLQIDRMPIGLIVWDKDFRVQTWNSSAEKIFGFTEKEARGKHPYNLIVPKEAQPHVDDIWRRLLEGDSTAHSINENVTKDNRVIHCDWSNTPLKKDDGEVMGVLSMVQDITERRLAENELKESFKKLRKALGGIIQVTSTMVEARDPYTAGHQRRVTDLARTIATEMGLEKDQIEGIRTAGVIHDIGKIVVPAEILSKPSRLTMAEFEIIKAHPQVAHEILKEIDFPWPIAQIVLQHHERMDGSGYPLGISGPEILMEARVLAVADVVEAMATHRPYRPALGIGKALDEISKGSGKLYDPEVVNACLKLFEGKGYEFKQASP